MQHENLFLTPLDEMAQVIGNKWLKYLELLHGGFDESQAFQELGLKRFAITH
jgi:DNA-directed RNA polymerase subunit N (RpoN/RPB10)